MFCEENRHNQYPKAGCNQRKAGEVGKWGLGGGEGGEGQLRKDEALWPGNSHPHCRTD